MLAKVAIDLALDRLFTYQVPEEFEKKLTVGQLLSVPFGHRTARGFVLEVSDGEADGAYKLKPIAAIEDEIPFFSPSLLELVKRVAAYTASPLESVLKAALPSSVLKKNAKAKEQIFVEPVPGKDASALTDRRRWLYEQLVRLDGGWMSRLCSELKTTPATIRELESSGFVKVEVRAKRRDPLRAGRILPTKPLALNPGQSDALEKIIGVNSGISPLLLHGITGSGKTEVYLQAIAKVLEDGMGAIVMVPEISLTPQTVQRFAGRFGDCVAVLHSALSDGERYDEWHRIRSGQARVVIGPRSAVFAPVSRLGLIIVDEEHESSYKQEENPRYHARDVAVLRAMIEGARVVLGSATPSLESWMNVKSGKYRIAKMDVRAGAGTLPSVNIVEMRDGSIYSKELLEAIQLRLDRNEQTVLFLNRRGYSRSMTCACGYVATCAQCDIPYTYHKSGNCLRCHVCGGWETVPAVCPECKRAAFSFEGIGTQRAEAALRKCFPKASVLRMDADSTSHRHSHDEILGAFRRREADILLGTQMIAKGLDFPNVTLVGVLNADSSLNMADFRAEERTFQLLSQVSGRAGRSELPGEVFIQTRDPSARTIIFAAKGNYDKFAESELVGRKECFLPPFCRLSAITVRAKDERLAENWAQMYAESLKAYAKTVGDLKVGDAVPGAMAKADGWYRWQIVMRSPVNSKIVGAWRWISKVRSPPADVRIVIDIDAMNLA